MQMFPFLAGTKNLSFSATVCFFNSLISGKDYGGASSAGVGGVTGDDSPQKKSSMVCM